jgi:hypothetical protein
MKRIHPLLLILLFVLLLAGGVVWRVSAADECLDKGGLVVGSMTRSQHCVRQ